MSVFKKMLKNEWLKAILAAVGVLGILFFASSIFADKGPTVGAGQTITKLQTTIGTTVVQVASIISNIALVAGIGFLLASFFKFDQHKKNPTQIPVSQPLTLLIIGAGLCLFPTIMPLVQSAVFGTQAEKGQVGTATVTGLIGGGS